ISGWALMFPFTTHFFAGTFGKINMVLGTELPTALTILQEQQLNSLWHSIMAIFMICVIFGHIYIGTVGMERAFDAMGSGEVDLNWAKEHHSLWVEENLDDIHDAPGGGPAPQPAE
ncbi:MAG: formate dehydrogenase subunit gamma, partial [Roseibium sp.]